MTGENLAGLRGVNRSKHAESGTEWSALLSCVSFLMLFPGHETVVIYFLLRNSPGQNWSDKYNCVFTTRLGYNMTGFVTC